MKYIRFGKNIFNMLITVFNGITPTQIYLNGINGMVIINTKTCYVFFMNNPKQLFLLSCS